MIKKWLTLILIFLLALTIVLLIKQGRGVGQDNIQPKKETKGQQEIVLHKNFFEKEGFYKAVTSVENTPSQNDISAIVIPHHLLASKFIADSMKRTSGRSIKQIVIIGPNHNNIGVEQIATVSAEWQTPFGYVETDKDLANSFLREFHLFSSPEVFREEHSIGALLPFVKYYFKEAKILPIAFSSNANMRDAEEVASWLAENLDDNSLVIISTDFSHYLTREEAEKKDEITKELISGNNIEAIMRLTNDNVDSPASLVVGMIYAENKSLAANFLHHANSFDLVNNKSSVTTSYFAISFNYR